MTGNWAEDTRARKAAVEWGYAKAVGTMRVSDSGDCCFASNGTREECELLKGSIAEIKAAGIPCAVHVAERENNEFIETVSLVEHYADRQAERAPARLASLRNATEKLNAARARAGLPLRPLPAELPDPERSSHTDHDRQVAPWEPSPLPRRRKPGRPVSKPGRAAARVREAAYRQRMRIRAKFGGGDA
jgi:hypothetical protein